jgi:hypothetical protein
MAAAGPVAPMLACGFFFYSPSWPANAGASGIQSSVSQSTSCIHASKLSEPAIQSPEAASFVDMIGWAVVEAASADRSVSGVRRAVLGFGVESRIR